MTPEARGRPPLADLATVSARELTDDDERLHPDAGGTAYWTETSWWGFTIPSTGAGGWIYLQVRPKIGMASLGVWVWDRSSLYPFAAPYGRQFNQVVIPPGMDLTSVGLHEYGFELECLEPFARHRIRYQDDDHITLSLEFEAVLPPRPLGVGDRTGHLDQALWARGLLTVAGDEFRVDGPAFRDRTWSERPDRNPQQRKNCYVWGVGDDRSSLVHALAVYDSTGLVPEHFGGTVASDGVPRALTAFRRRCVQRGADGRPIEVQLELDDDTGRRSIVRGTSQSCLAITAFPGYLCYASVMRWDLDGRELWGEDHETWPFHALRSAAPPSITDRWDRPLG